MKKTVKQIFILLFWVAVWYVAVFFANKNLIMPLPTPLTVAKSFFENICMFSFWAAAAKSLLRIISGYVLAVITGTLTAFLCVKHKIFGDVISPLIHLIKAVPVASFIFLVFLWMQKSLIPGFTSFLIVFPIIEANAESGIKGINKRLTEMADLFKLSKLSKFKYIIFPDIMPPLASGMITGMGLAWKSGIAAEVIARPDIGIGNILWSAKSVIDYNSVFALTLFTVIISVLLEILIKHLLGGVKNDKF